MNERRVEALRGQLRKLLIEKSIYRGIEEFSQEPLERINNEIAETHGLLEQYGAQV